MEKNCNDSLNKIFEGISGVTYVEKPCKVVNVNSQHSVDVEYYDNGTADMIYNVPVKHIQTQNAYVFLGITPGDYGTIRFFDSDIENYYLGNPVIAPEVRKHDINDGVFSVGFYPKTEQYEFVQGDLVIGTPAGVVINITGTGVTITGEEITLNANTINIDGNTIIEGGKFLEHTHSNGNNGSPTGGVIRE